MFPGHGAAAVLDGLFITLLPPAVNTPNGESVAGRAASDVSTDAILPHLFWRRPIQDGGDIDSVINRPRRLILSTGEDHDINSVTRTWSYALLSYGLRDGWDRP